MLELCSRQTTGVPPECCCLVLEAVHWLELLKLGPGTCILANEDACGFVDADPCDMDAR